MAVSQEKLLRKAKQMREDYEVLMHSVEHPHVEVGEVREISLRLIEPYETKLLIYYPKGYAGQLLPAYIVLHSGAWARGSAYFDDYVNRVTANRVNCIVVAVEFQLAPEAMCPLQPRECYEAAAWVFEHAKELGIDAKRIALGGHNSGGTLAAVVSHMARDSGLFRPCCVLLDCAMMDISCDLDELPEFDDDDPMRGPIRGAFFNTCYLGDLSRQKEPLASPGYEKDLRGLPPTFVIYAELDPMRDYSVDYYQRLKAAGNDCRLYCHEGKKHGFNVQPGIATQEEVDAAFLLMDEYLSEQFWGRQG